MTMSKNLAFFEDSCHRFDEFITYLNEIYSVAKEFITIEEKINFA